MKKLILIIYCFTLVVYSLYSGAKIKDYDEQVFMNSLIFLEDNSILLYEAIPKNSKDGKLFIDYYEKKERDLYDENNLGFVSSSPDTDDRILLNELLSGEFDFAMFLSEKSIQNEDDFHSETIIFENDDSTISLQITDIDDVNDLIIISEYINNIIINRYEFHGQLMFFYSNQYFLNFGITGFGGSGFSSSLISWNIPKSNGSIDIDRIDK